MQTFSCPICGKIHENLPYKCECGYEEIKLSPKDYNDKNKLLFAKYKFSKLIFNKQIEWKQSHYDLINYSTDEVCVYEIFDDRSIAYVDLKIEDKIVEAAAGVLAFKYNISSLIINVDYLDYDMLDESNVQMIFIGERVKDIPALVNTNLKYLEVDKKNPYFTSLNNVLFNKKMTKLILYCKLKPEEEYTIPETVKVVSRWAFTGFSNEYVALKVIHCSKNVKFEEPNCTPSPFEKIKIIRDK